MKIESTLENTGPKKHIETGVASPNLALLNVIKNWEEKENGEICIKKIEATPTPLWAEGWYKNPSSGRSLNYGINTEKLEEHSTVIVKGGSFFVDEKNKEFFSKTNPKMHELYGGLSFDAAKKEYEIAILIQGQFRSLLNKKANCPEPIDVKVISSIMDNKNKVLDLPTFFKNEAESETKETTFTPTNFLKAAIASGVDIQYPMSEGVPEEIKKDPFKWLFEQVLEKNKQGIYRYQIDGPNTRLLDLMTLDVDSRQKYFIEANNATNVNEAVEKFSSKLGEFYGVLHKSDIGYHSGFSEHCTLIDITISGMVMDIGGLSKSSSTNINSEFEKELYEIAGVAKEVESKSEGLPDSYFVQIIKTTNLIAYLCKNILKTDITILENALNTFWRKYKNLYSDENIKSLSEFKNKSEQPDKIRTKYLDNTSGDWVKLATDLEHLSSEY